MKRLLPLVLLVSGCSERLRPDPFGPGTPIVLTAEIQSPAPNVTLVAGSTISVRVRGTERSLRLSSVGFVARHFQANTALDSVIITFLPRADTTHTFSYRLPPTLPTNAQVDFVAIAASGTTTIRSSPASVVIIGCTPGMALCQQ